MFPIHMLRRVVLVTLLAVGAVAPMASADCPEAVLFTPAETGSTADTGFTGLALNRPIFGNTLELEMSCPVTTPPCGTCTITGARSDALGTFQRCTNDTSIKCTVATEVADCGAVDTCRLFVTVPQFVAVGGVAACYTNELTGPVSGTVDESGALDVTLDYVGRIYIGESISRACPMCVGDPAPNDAIQGGTCASGPRVGLPCDGNGPPPALYDDFGTSSFDCPPSPGSFIGTLTPGPITFSTGTQTRTLSAASPNCTQTGATSLKCFCDTCNNAAAEPCQSNADCPDPAGPIGPICGGRRCDKGLNEGAPCANASECPGGGTCKRLGEPTQPNACNDDTSTPGDERYVCDDTGTVGDGLGECLNGPADKSCTNHPNRGCTTQLDCDDVPGTCQLHPRLCYVNDGTIGQSLSATGVATPAVANVSDPTTLGMITCQSTSRVAAVDAVIGLPGLARNHHTGTLTFGDTFEPSCPSLPDTCRLPVTPGRSQLKMKDRSPDAKDQLKWQWKKGAATTLAELGDPTVADPYALCVYDANGLRMSMNVPAGGICDGHPCWKANTKGFLYKRKNGSPRGITKLVLRSGETGKSQIQADGKGDFLPLPSFGSLTAPLVVQLRNRTSGLCWGVTYSAPFQKITATDLQAKD